MSKLIGSIERGDAILATGVFVLMYAIFQSFGYAMFFALTGWFWVLLAFVILDLIDNLWSK